MGEADGLRPPDRASIVDYLLGRQFPGHAEGTWRLLQSSDGAARWAGRVRELLVEAGLEDPPPLPSDEDALSPTQRMYRRAARRAPQRGTLAERREERSRRCTAANAQQAAEFISSYRSEAIAVQTGFQRIISLLF